MFNSDKSHTFFNEDKIASESGAVVLYRFEEQPEYSAVRRSIAAFILTAFLGILTLQAGWVYNANAEGNPITAPTPPITSQESPPPAPSHPGYPVGPITSPETPTPTPTPTPTSTPTSTPTAAQCPAGWTVTIVDGSILCVGQSQTQSQNQNNNNVSVQGGVTISIITNPITSPETSPSPSVSPSTAPNTSGSSSSSGGGSVSASGCSNEAPKSAPKIVSAVTSGKNEITLTWNKAEGPVTSYVIAYGMEKGKPLYGNPNTGNVTSYSVKGLAGGLTYYFKVRAGNDCMPGAYSEEIAVKVGGKFKSDSSQALLINAPAQGFKAGVLGKSTIKPSSKLALAKPAVFTQTPQPQPQSNGGLISKVFNFISSFFKP